MICFAANGIGADRGCRREIPAGEEYRCLDCDAVMHKECLRWHCSADEKDMLIFNLKGETAALRAHLERMCMEGA